MLWTIEILSYSKSYTDPYEGNMILALTRLSAAVLLSVLLYKIGKQPVALVSALGVGFICISLGTYLHYSTEPNIVPQICFIAYIAFATLGYYTLPYLIMTEMYPLQIRGFMAGISVSFVSFLMFATNKFYPYIKNLLGFNNILITFGVSSLLGSLFLYFYLPETQFLMLQDIEEYYNERRPTLVSQRRVMSIQLRDASSKSMASLSRNRELSKTRNSLIRASNDRKDAEKRKERINKKKQKKEKDSKKEEAPKENRVVRLSSDSDHKDKADSEQQKANTI